MGFFSSIFGGGGSDRGDPEPWRRDGPPVPGPSRGLLRRLVDAVRGYPGPDATRPDSAPGNYLLSEKLASSPRGISFPWFLPYHDADYTGESSVMRLAYRRMMSDPNVKAAVLAKILSVAALKLTIQPADKKSDHDRKVADFVDWNLNERLAGCVPSLIWSVLSGALLDGYSVSEKVWTREAKGRYAGLWPLRDLKPKDVGNDLVIQTDEFRNVTGLMGLRYNGGIEYSPADFLIYRHLPLYDSPTGTSDMRAAYSRYWMLDTLEKLRAIGCEKSAYPFLIGFWKNAAQQPGLEGALARAKFQNWLSAPDDCRVEVLNMAGSGDSIIAAAIKDLKHDIFLCIRGALLQQLEGETTDGRGNSQVHQSEAELFVWYLAETVCALLNDRDAGLIKDIVDLNFVVGEYPRATLGAVDVNEQAQRIAIFTGLHQIGLALSKDQLYEEFGARPPEADNPDDALPGQQGGAAGGPGGKGGFGGGPGGPEPPKPPTPGKLAEFVDTDENGVYHGPEAPGPGWVNVGEGPHHGKMWKRQEGREQAGGEGGGKLAWVRDLTRRMGEAANHIAVQLRFKVGQLAPDILDTIEDTQRIFYAGGKSQPQPLAALGIPLSGGQLVAVTSHVLAKAALLLRKKVRGYGELSTFAEDFAGDLAGREPQGDHPLPRFRPDQLPLVADAVRLVFEEMHREIPELGTPPTRAEVLRVLKRRVADRMAEDEQGHEHGKDGKFAAKGGGGEAAAKGKTAPAPAKRLVHERQEQIDDHALAQARHVVSEARKGKLSLVDASSKAYDLEEKVERQTAANFRTRYRAFRDRVAEKYGREALDSQEWQEIKATFELHEDAARKRLRDFAEEVQGTLDDHYRGRDERPPLDELENWITGNWRQQYQARDRWKEEISQAIKDFTAKHGNKLSEDFAEFADAAGHEHGRDGRFTGKGGGGGSSGGKGKSARPAKSTAGQDMGALAGKLLSGQKVGKVNLTPERSRELLNHLAQPLVDGKADRLDPALKDYLASQFGHVKLRSKSKGEHTVAELLAGKPPEKPAAFDPAAHHDRAASAVADLVGRHGQAGMVQLRQALSGHGLKDRASQDAVLKSLWKAGVITGQGFEGRVGTPEERQAGAEASLKMPGHRPGETELIGSFHLRPDWEEKLARLKGAQ